MIMMMMPWWLVVPLPGVGVDLVRPLYLFIISYYYFGVNLETNDGGCDTTGGGAWTFHTYADGGGIGNTLTVCSDEV